MKRVLVISDNALLTEYFQSECDEQGVDKIATVVYQYSLVNKTPQAMIALGASPVDIKDPATVQKSIDLYDLIISLHCKQLFPESLVSSVTCMNVHPGYNPYNRGWYPQVFSILNKKQAGATIHIVDEEVDHGEIIDQLKVDVYSYDTSLEVYEKIISAEKILIKKNLLDLVTGNYSVRAADIEGNYNSLQDFNSLCDLDLDNIGTLREHIDLLRALSHGDIKNAFFYDELGKKVFIRVMLEEDILIQAN